MSLAWCERAGRSCLRIACGAGTDAHELRALPTAEISRRLAILPSEVADTWVQLGTRQSMSGTLALDGDAVYFTPRFPFVPGASYVVVLDRQAIGTIQRPVATCAPVARVVAMYPRVAVVPVNLLKLYIEFSAPMSEGVSRRAVRVRRDDTDEPLRDVFLDMSPELWSSDRTRLTLLLDPGRIKRGLVPNLEAGYPLVEGQPIVVTVDARFTDAAGVPLCESASVRYDVGPAMRSRVDHTQWSYGYPRAGSIDPLVVVFDRPFDHALLEHSLHVHDDDGAPRVGRVTLGADERSWRFEPDAPWHAGRHVLTIDGRLEDLAGNSLMRVFDRDLSRPEDDPADARLVEVAFTCRSADSAT